MPGKQDPQAIEPREGFRTLAARFAEYAMLVWMLGITGLWWLLYGPGMTFITQRLAVVPWLGNLRTTLLQFFTYTSWGVH